MVNEFAFHQVVTEISGKNTITETEKKNVPQLCGFNDE